MDIFKAMGVTVGNDIKMIDQIESKTLEKGDESTQIVRKGSDISARERLEGQIEKGFVVSRAPQHAPGHDNSQTDYAGTLKNTHGENWHTDNDKQVEEFLSAAAQIDREFPAESNANTKTPRHPGTYAPTGEQSHTLEFKSLSQEELFMKAFNEVDEVVVKGKKKKFDFDKDGKIDAHEEHHAEMEAEKACGVSKKSDLDDIFDVVKGFNNAPPKMGVSKKAPKLPKDPVQIKQEAAQNKDLGVKKGTTEEDVAGMSTIAPDPYATNPDLIATVHENSPDVTERLRPAPLEKGGPGSGVRGHKTAMSDRAVSNSEEREWNEEKEHGGKFTEYRPSQSGVNEQAHPAKEMKRRNPSSGASYAGESLREGDADSAKNQHRETLRQIKRQPAPNLPKSMNSFIKAMGPGGMVFDFGNRTGNPIADRATDLLNQFSDPIQANNAQYNATSYQKAITD